MPKKYSFKDILLILALICLLVVGAFWGREMLINQNNNQQNVVITIPTNPLVEVTTTPTNSPVVVTNAPMNSPVVMTNAPTNSPVIVTSTPVVVTSEPIVQATTTPEIWYIPTYVPVTQAPVTVPPVQVVITATPVPTATQEPVITATSVPTATPEPVITATPVPTATQEPVITATPEPTKVPVTEVPPKYTNEAFETTRSELYKLTAGVNEILPDYTASRKYDLYSYIDFEKTDPYKLFEVLREVYVDTLAHSLDFKFDYDNSVQGIEKTLNTAYCSNCGKVKCIYDRQNDAKMATLLGNVSKNDIMNVNLLLLNFINTNSYVSNENINERLIICCSCGN